MILEKGLKIKNLKDFRYTQTSSQVMVHSWQNQRKSKFEVRSVLIELIFMLFQDRVPKQNSLSLAAV